MPTKVTNPLLQMSSSRVQLRSKEEILRSQFSITNLPTRICNKRSYAIETEKSLKKQKGELPLNNTECNEIKNEFLMKLRNFLEGNNEVCCGDVLEGIYECAESGVKFTTEEQKEIEALLKKKIDAIFKFLIIFGWSFNPTNEISPLEYRSALEIIVNTYKAYPTDLEGKKVTKKLEDARSVLDKAAKQWVGYVLSSLDCEGYSREDLVRPESIPKSHTWWLEEE